MRTLSSTPLSKTDQADATNEADNAEAEASGAKLESPAAAKPEEGNEAGSENQAGDKASGSGDAESSTQLSAANDADGRGGAVDDASISQMDDAKSEDPIGHAETPAPADDTEDTTLADGARVSESSTPAPHDEPAFPPTLTKLPVRACTKENHDTITATALRRLIPRDESDVYVARVPAITSRLLTRLGSNQVACVEFDDNGRKSVVQVRVMKCTDGQPFARPGATRADDDNLPTCKERFMPDSALYDPAGRVQTCQSTRAGEERATPASNRRNGGPTERRH
eukprot:6182923-Pleurochrysis_carterae.AAC.4